MSQTSEPTAFRKALHLGSVLFLVTAVTGLILGVVERGTRIAIEQAQAEARAEALRNVLPDAATFASVPLESGEAQPLSQRAGEITGVEKGMDREGKTVGCCVSVAAKGYGGTVDFVVGITDKGVVRGINILSHSETPGLGAKSTEPEFYGQFENREVLPLKVVKGSAGAADEIAAISGATITSTAVTSGVNAAVDYWAEHIAGKEAMPLKGE